MSYKGTILIIDDDPNNLDILELDLEDEGYRTVKAADGVLGWKKLQEYKMNIDLILLDRMMPNMDGIEFMKKLKGDGRVSDIPVVMQTAVIQASQVEECIGLGVNYYLAKPYQKEKLITIVNKAIAKE